MIGGGFVTFCQGYTNVYGMSDYTLFVLTMVIYYIRHFTGEMDLFLSELCFQRFVHLVGNLNHGIRFVLGMFCSFFS